ncbi:MAG: barstar family protein [Cyanobacteria bacterium P01_E01_bin.43]
MAVTLTPHRTITINCNAITDAASFHDVFSLAFGFPEFYGRNMDAWIDCMSSLDDPDDGLSTLHCPPDGVLNLQLDNVASFSRRCPDLYFALIECAAFVNWRRTEIGESPVLCISFSA